MPRADVILLPLPCGVRTCPAIYKTSNYAKCEPIYDGYAQCETIDDGYVYITPTAIFLSLQFVPYQMLTMIKYRNILFITLFSSYNI